MLEELKQAVYEANMELPRRGLVTYTWGNVSGIDREKGLVVIKPSGVDYEQLAPGKLVVLDLDGNIVEGGLNPSSDTKTHLELYKAFPGAGGRGAHPQPPRGGLGPGGGGHPLLRHHPRRLFLRPGALRPGPDQRGTGRRLREKHRQGHRGDLHGQGHRPGAPARRSSAAATAPSPGAKRRPRRCITRRCWKKWQRWRC